MSDTILITGASGKLGQLVLDQLLESGKVKPSDIIATSRDPAKLSAYAEKGVDTRAADFDDAASLDTAFAGARHVLIISTDALGEEGKRLRQHLAAVAAAQKAGATHIVYTSMPNPENSAVTFAPDHLQTENAIKATGIPYTILRNGWYMENLFLSTPSALASGHWYTSSGKGRLAHIARADVAKAVVAALLSASSESRTYTLTGKTLHTTDQVAALVSAATKKPIAVIHVNDEQLAGGMKQHGVPKFLIPILISFEVNTREGLIGMVTDDARTLAGQDLQTLEDFVAANAEAFKG